MNTILHIAEAFGGGIVTFIANLTSQQVGHYRVIVAHGIRPETHKNFKDLFDSRVEFIEIKNFSQDIKLSGEIKALGELHKLIKGIKPDVIHMHSSQAGVLGKLASIDYSCRKVYSPHGFSFMREDVSPWKRFIFKALEWTFARFDCIMVASSITEFAAAKTLTSKSILIKNGISFDSLIPFEKIQASNEVPVVGMVGRALSQKNPAMFNSIAEKMPNVHFEWIGDGTLRNQLSSSNIHIVGWGPREEALEYVAKSDIYIMTSLWEGMPLSLLEAMYLRKACVVTNVVGNRDVINNGINGYVCDSIDEFVDRINYLIVHPEERGKMGEQGHKDVIELYSNKKMEQLFSEAYTTDKKSIKKWHFKDVND